MTKEEAKQKIAELIRKYESLSPSEIKGFHEAKTKQGFIEPLFRALGWNFDDTNEVAPEEKASNGRVDYAFKLHGVSQFYLEAKQLKADLTNLEYIKQAVTYAYSKGVTWAVLTDFRELRLFNAQANKTFLTLTYRDYTANFDKLWLFSRESLENGLLNKEAAQYGALPPSLPIETRLYKQLRQWREELFNQLHGHNKELSPNQIDEVVQRFFGRFIFIRTCEDRNLEDKRLLAAANQWKSAGYKGELVEELRQIFKSYWDIYDSELFDKHLTDSVFIEGSTIEKILNGLYEIPGSLASYNFNDIDADVLGAVYEQYLGYVAAKVKERVEAQLKLGIADEEIFEIVSKKQRRKEQGIYYTPKFVTDYIVKETVGRFIKEHDYNVIRTVKILDPACGSGSFLIRAYHELLDYHAKQRGKSLNQLDQKDRLPVLLTNIYGVDLDMQAVEITRLNLLLRTLTEKSKLPYLSNNIRQGNSLISSTEEELKGYFGDNWRDKKPFNWEQEFKDIMTQGGFDVVIGNPPYVKIQSLLRDEADYYREMYQSAFGSFDIYVLFLEQAVKLLKPGGWLGFITSGKFLKADYGKKIQQVLRQECTIESIVDLSAQKVFAEATTYPVIMVLKKGTDEKPLHYTFIPEDIDLSKVALPIDVSVLPTSTTNQEAVVKGIWPPMVIGDTLLTKLFQNTVSLGELAGRIFQGLITSADKIYILEKRGESSGGKVRVYSRSLERGLELETALLKPLLSGKDVERYGYPIPNQLLLFPYKISEGKAELILPDEFASAYPKCWEYLLQNREALENRERGKMRHEGWYAFGRTQNLAMHEQRKMAIPRLISRLAAIYDREENFYLDNVDVGGLILKEQSNSAYLYITGLLNSRLLDYYLHRISVPFRGGFYSANRQFLEPLPIRRINFANLKEKKMHDDLVALVDKILELNKRLASIHDTYCNERDELLREIKRTDKEIDNLVYDLYGLTVKERKVVEGET